MKTAGWTEQSLRDGWGHTLCEGATHRIGYREVDASVSW